MQLVSDALNALVPFYPSEIRAEILSAIPDIQYEAVELAAQVLRAERDGVPYAVAATRPDFAMLGRVHHGVTDLLQRRVPPELRSAFFKVATATNRGAFVDIQRALARAAVPALDPQAALLRFLMYESARLNLLVLTWDIPDAEVYGSLAVVDREAERILREILQVSDIGGPDLRPAHLLMSELMVRLAADLREVQHACREWGEEGLRFIERMIEATRVARTLDGPDAVLAHASVYEEELGSQQIADRYPWYFATAGAVDQRRSRLRKRLSGKRPRSPAHDRLIDIVRDGAPEEEGLE